MIIAGLGLAVFLVLLRRGTLRGLGEEILGTEEENSLPIPWDSLTSELSGKIFDSEDSEFVHEECSRELERKFRAERTTLALDWLREVQMQVNFLIRRHLRSARADSDLNPADELRLGFEFLLFQVTTGILYLVIWTSGPLHAAKLVGYPMNLANQLREMTKDILPSGAQVAVELLDIDSQVKNRTSTP
jgi:hypothetical protein